MSTFKDKFYQKCDSLKKNHFFKTGLPFLLLVVGGSFALQIVQKIKWEHKQQKQHIEHLRLKAPNLNKPINMEEELRKVQKMNEDDTWENVRGPRLWEDNTEWLSKKEMQEKRFQEKLAKASTI